MFAFLFKMAQRTSQLFRYKKKQCPRYIASRHAKEFFLAEKQCSFEEIFYAGKFMGTAIPVGVRNDELN